MSHSWINEELQAMSDRNENYLSQPNQKIHKNFLTFFDLTGIFKHVDEICKKYEDIPQMNPEQKCIFPSLRLPLEIDLQELQNISGQYIFKLLEKEPHIAHSIIHNIVYTYILSKESFEEFQPTQLEIHLRLKSLDCLTKYDINHIPVGILSSIHGTLFSISTPIKYIRSYVVKCLSSSCPYSKGQRIIGAPPTKLAKCSICDAAMQEIQEACETGEQSLGLFVSLPEFQNLHISPVYRQAISLCFQDELMKALEPGLEYEIAGQMGVKSFQVLAVQIKKYTIKEIEFHLMPSSIRKLQHDLENVYPDSPWTLVGMLASQLAANEYPDSCYFNLKMGLLLSLASQGQREKPVPVFAVGPDTHIAHRLMRRVAALRRKGAPLEWSTSSPSGQMRWETRGSDSLGWVEAGPLLLAAGGVCCLGDWAKLKGKAIQAVLSAVETGYVFVDSQNTKNLTLPCFPLRCSVWMYSLWNGKQKTADLKSIKSLTQIFGIPFLATDEKNLEKIIYSTLIRYLNTSLLPKILISEADLMEYLNIVTMKEVHIGASASQLIQKYFVASRRTQPDRLPVNAVSLITSLSEAYARLAMKDEVIPEHVIAVIQLYEETLCYLYGSNVIYAPPPTVFPNEMPVPQWINYSLQEFSSWLQDFIHTFVGNSSQI